jgi:predicted PurR-regulated permease PerM
MAAAIVAPAPHRIPNRPSHPGPGGVGTFGAMEAQRRSVDVRDVALTTFVAVCVVIGVVGSIWAVGRLWRIVSYLLVAIFFAVVLTPAVDFLQHRAKMRRGVATLIVFLLGLVVLTGLIYAFVRPIVDQGRKFSDNLPEMIDDAQEGKGRLGKLITKYDLEEKFNDNREAIDEQINSAGSKGVSIVGTVFSGIIAAVTVMVLTILLLLGGPDLSASLLALVPERRRERVRRVATDASLAVSGYMFGNVVISVLAGIAAYVFLRIAGVPYPEVLALWVAFADLIPLVGATLGAIPPVLVAFLQSTPAGIATIIFFVLYQQFENNVLQVTVMARTVKINPLGILVSVLIGVEVFGLLGALLAIPVAGVIQVVVRDLWNERDGRPKDPITLGADEEPFLEGDPPVAPA